MIPARFIYPGALPERGYSGGLTPEVVRSSRMESVVSYGLGDARGPAFGELSSPALKSRHQLEWPALSHEEAADIVRQWEDAEYGARPLSWTPDDRSDPLVVLMIERPRVRYRNAAVASVSCVLEEQR